MLVEHEGRTPTVDPDAWVAPTAVLCGDVRVAAGARVLWNAVLVDDGGPVEIGERTIVMEHALVRGRASHPVRVGAGAEVRIHGVVHVNSVLAEGAVVPTGWVAVGDPAEVFAPGRHDDIWAIQRELDFPGTVLGIERGAPAREATSRYSESFGRHRDDRIIE